MADVDGRVHHVNFSVSDLATSSAWYSRLFGMTTLAELEDPAGAWSKVILRHSSGLLIGLTAHRPNDGAPASELRSGLDHVAFSVSGYRALAEWEGYLDELGVDHSPIKQTPLGRLITLRDPDNIQLEVYASAE